MLVSYSQTWSLKNFRDKSGFEGKLRSWTERSLNGDWKIWVKLLDERRRDKWFRSREEDIDSLTGKIELIFIWRRV